MNVTCLANLPTALADGCPNHSALVSANTSDQGDVPAESSNDQNSQFRHRHEGSGYEFLTAAALKFLTLQVGIH